MATEGGIIYAAVQTKGQTTAWNGKADMREADVASLASKVLQQVDLNQDARKSYSSKGYTFNYVTSHRNVFLCVAEENFPRRICFAFLEKVSNEQVMKGKVSKSFLEQEMKYYSTNPDVDKIRNVQKQVDDVKGIMRENIEKVLERGEKLEDLESRAQELAINSDVFQKSAKKVRCELFKKNIKLTIILVAVIVLVLVVIGVILYIKLR